MESVDCSKVGTWMLDGVALMNDYRVHGPLSPCSPTGHRAVPDRRWQRLAAPSATTRPAAAPSVIGGSTGEHSDGRRASSILQRPGGQWRRCGAGSVSNCVSSRSITRRPGDLLALFNKTRPCSATTCYFPSSTAAIYPLRPSSPLQVAKLPP